jgi:hypothetical protein
VIPKSVRNACAARRPRSNEQDVGGLDVAVDEAASWAASSADATWPTISPPPRRQRPFAQALGQIDPVDVAHDQVELPAVLARRVDGDDVGCSIAAARRASRAKRSRKPGSGGPRGVDDLEGHHAVEARLARR